MEEAHAGVCEAHQSVPNLHDRVKRIGYYWPTMLRDCIDLEGRCDACQLHANFIHKPLKPPNCHILPFRGMGAGCRRTIHTEVFYQDIYILAATDYFSKWAEEIFLKEVKKENVVDFI